MDAMHAGMIVCIVLAVLFFILSIVLFFKFDILGGMRPNASHGGKDVASLKPAGGAVLPSSSGLGDRTPLAPLKPEQLGPGHLPAAASPQRAHPSQGLSGNTGQTAGTGAAPVSAQMAAASPATRPSGQLDQYGRPVAAAAGDDDGSGSTTMLGVDADGSAATAFLGEDADGSAATMFLGEDADGSAATTFLGADDEGDAATSFLGQAGGQLAADDEATSFLVPPGAAAAGGAGATAVEASMPPVAADVPAQVSFNVTRETLVTHIAE
jgi:hypothetical protein